MKRLPPGSAQEEDGSIREPTSGLRVDRFIILAVGYDKKKFERATMPGWYRMMGAVTPVMKGTRLIAWRAELMTVHAKGHSIPRGIAIR